MGRADGMGPRRSTVSSEFPAGIDRVATGFSQERGTLAPKPEERTLTKSKQVNQQMGELMAKCIAMLENEIFKPIPSPSDAAVEDDAVVPSINDEEDVKDPVEYEGSEKSLVLEDKESTEHKSVTSKAPVQDEATIILALAGLKHVRDVLIGKQQHFDASVIDSKPLPRQATNEDWDIVEHKEAVLDSPLSPHEPQPTKTTIFIPQTSSSIIANDMDPDYGKDKPLPPIVSQDQSAIIAELKLPQVPVQYIPTNPTPLKQPIKYRIEDLLSDPDLQLASPKASANVKFKWMLSGENENEDGSTNANLTTSHDLFKTEQAPRISPRKRNSFIINKSKPVEGGEAVDPLDAKNVDNRRDYEFDML